VYCFTKFSQREFKKKFKNAILLTWKIDDDSRTIFEICFVRLLELIPSVNMKQLFILGAFGYRSDEAAVLKPINYFVCFRAS
jgi:hypothetical protein